MVADEIYSMTQSGQALYVHIHVVRTNPLPYAQPTTMRRFILNSNLCTVLTFPLVHFPQLFFQAPTETCCDVFSPT